MTAQPHVGTRANYLELTSNQARLICDPSDRQDEYRELMTKIHNEFVLHNTALVLDARVFAHATLDGGISKVLNAVLKLGKYKVPVLYVHHDTAFPMTGFNCPVFEAVKFAMDMMQLPFAYNTYDEDTQQQEAHIVGTSESMATSHQSVILEVYERFALGQEFTTADLIETIPVPEGKTLSVHSSAIGNALKSICAKYPNLLCFDSRLVRNDDPKKRNQNTFFYSIPNPLPIQVSESTKIGEEV